MVYVSEFMQFLCKANPNTSILIDVVLVQTKSLEVFLHRVHEHNYEANDIYIDDMF